MEQSKENEIGFRSKASLGEKILSSEINKDASSISIEIGGINHVMSSKEFLFLQSFFNNIATNLYEQEDYNKVAEVLSNEEAYETLEKEIKFDFINVAEQKKYVAENPLTPEECITPEVYAETALEKVEHFEEEIHEVAPKVESVIDMGSILGVVDEEAIKEECKQTVSTEVIDELKQKPFDAPEIKEEEFNKLSEEALPKETEEEFMNQALNQEFVQVKLECVTELKDYASLHKREYADLSKLQLTAELIISQGDLIQMDVIIKENDNLIKEIESLNDEEKLEAVVNNITENAMILMTIHRKYFRIANPNSKKTLVQGVFEAFNDFTVENKVELMKAYSEFLGEKEEVVADVFEDNSGTKVPKMDHLKQEENTSPNASMHYESMASDPRDSNPYPGPIHTSIPAPGDDEEDEEAKAQAEAENDAFISRMEALENMLTGDFEIVAGETPTYEKIEQIAKDHGELAAKEYVSSLSQEQREDLARERMEKIKQKHDAGHQITSETKPVTEDITPVAEI